MCLSILKQWRRRRIECKIVKKISLKTYKKKLFLLEGRQHVFLYLSLYLIDLAPVAPNTTAPVAITFTGEWMN